MDRQVSYYVQKDKSIHILVSTKSVIPGGKGNFTGTQKANISSQSTESHSQKVLNIEVHTQFLVRCIELK